MPCNLKTTVKIFVLSLPCHVGGKVVQLSLVLLNDRYQGLSIRPLTDEDRRQSAPPLNLPLSSGHFLFSDRISLSFFLRALSFNREINLIFI